MSNIDENDPLLANVNTGVLSVLEHDLGDVDSIYRVDMQPGLYRFELEDAKIVAREITIDKKAGVKEDRPELQLVFKVDEVLKLAPNADRNIDTSMLVGRKFVERRVQMPSEELKVWLGAVAGYLRSLTGKSVKGQLSDELENAKGSLFEAVIGTQRDKNDPTIFYPRLVYKGPKSFKPV